MQIKMGWMETTDGFRIMYALATRRTDLQECIGQSKEADRERTKGSMHERLGIVIDSRMLSITRVAKQCEGVETEGTQNDPANNEIGPSRPLAMVHNERIELEGAGP